MQITVKMMWDPEACVWVAESEDVPGLVLESGSLDALMERVRFAIPELLSLNGKSDFRDIQMNMISERTEQVAV